tara:strand:+ start:2161 stop:2880 length:720 start_codon:yes stop_codon:yes gene_type:complete
MLFFCKFGILFFWFCLASTVNGMSHEIDRSFKLIFWGTEFGEFKVNGETSNDKYSVSTTASGKSLIRLLSRFKISSGAVGSISGEGVLIPVQSISRWSIRGKVKETQLNYRDGTVIGFESSPELTRQYHIDNPIGIRNTIDPVSLVLWLLLEREDNQACKEKIEILDGFRISELSFGKKNVFQDKLECFGIIKRVKGFKKADINKEPLQFKLIYTLKKSKNFQVSEIEVETLFGKIILR